MHLISKNKELPPLKEVGVFLLKLNKSFLSININSICYIIFDKHNYYSNHFEYTLNIL